MLECTQTPAKLKLVRLNYVNVTVEGIPHSVSALIDGGSQLNVIDASLIKPFGLTPAGNILIRGIVGQPVQAELVKLKIQLSASENEPRVNDEFFFLLLAPWRYSSTLGRLQHSSP